MSGRLTHSETARIVVKWAGPVMRGTGSVAAKSPENCTAEYLVDAPVTLLSLSGCRIVICCLTLSVEKLVPGKNSGAHRRGV